MTTSAPAGTAARSQLTRPDGSPLRVLVVDDEFSICELLSMALRYEGWDVKSAGDGQTAVRTARDFRPDAVVLDMMLPDIDGLEVLRRLRQNPQTRRLPVVMLTSSVEETDRLASYDLGANSYVRKPVDFIEFSQAIQQLDLYWLVLNVASPY